MGAGIYSYAPRHPTEGPSYAHPAPEGHLASPACDWAVFVNLAGRVGEVRRLPAAWRTPLERHRLDALGLSLGCGLVAVLDEQACGLVETARLLRWLAGQSSGQCGPCVFGLPALAQLVDDIVNGKSRRADLRRLLGHAASIRGRGACGHPTGAVNLVESALETFAPELAMHLRGEVCDTLDGPTPFPLPHEPCVGR